MDDRGSGAAAAAAHAPAHAPAPVPAPEPVPALAPSPPPPPDHHGFAPHDDQAPQDDSQADSAIPHIASDATATAAAAVAAAAAAASSSAAAAAASHPAPAPPPDPTSQQAESPPISEPRPEPDSSSPSQLQDSVTDIPDQSPHVATNGYAPPYPHHVDSNSNTPAVTDHQLHGDAATLPPAPAEHEPPSMTTASDAGEMESAELSLSLSPASLAAAAATATQQIHDHQHSHDGRQHDTADPLANLEESHTHDLAHHQLSQPPQDGALESSMEHQQTHEEVAEQDQDRISIQTGQHQQSEESFQAIHHQHSPLSQHAPQYDTELAAVTSAPSGVDSITPTTAAHHGLQVLQAVSGPPTDSQYSHQAPLTVSAPDSLAQQYAHSTLVHAGNPGFATNGLSHQQQHFDPTHTSASNGANGSGSQKVTRLRRACDMCSTRKVKCDESGPPCKPCSDLGVDCTFSRAMKRRGPPNKHAEAAKAAKRSRLEGSVGGPPISGAGPSPVCPPGTEMVGSISPQTMPPATLHHPQHQHQSDDARNSQQPGLTQSPSPPQADAESIAPMPVLQLLVDDFFTYIHPLMPFPHEPTFRQSFVNRADRTDRGFLSLLASMVGILVASFPRSARSHLKASHSTDLFPTSIKMIENCRNIALQARGAFFMANDDMTVDDAATSYFLALSAAYTLQWKPCKRFMAETLTFCRETGAHRARDAAMQEVTGGYESHRPVNHITDQMSKRIFWVMVAGIRTMTQLGASINELPLPPPTSQEPYPDQPAEVDDEYIFSDHILPQPEGVPSLITGFNRNIRVYTTMNELVGVDMCYGINFFDWRAQSNILSNGLIAAKQATDDLPPELQVLSTMGSLSGEGGFDYGGLQYHPPAFPAAQPADDLRYVLAQQPTRRRQLQFEIQKANIYASGLATRSYFVERYLNLRDAHRGAHANNHNDGGGGHTATTPTSPDQPKQQPEEDERDAMVAAERELIVHNLLAVCGSISQRNMEPNGGSLIYKIRQVASTLLNDAPERKGPVAVKAEEYLGRFLDILMRLEKTGGGAGERSAETGGLDDGYAPAGALPGAGPGVGAGPGIGASTMTPQDEEAELQCWASLREYQLQFAASGGFMAEN